MGGLFDEACQRGGDPPHNRLRAHRPEGTGGVQSGSHLVDCMESRFPRGELGKVVAPDRAAVLLWGARVDDELADGGEHPRRLASKPGEVKVVHGIEAGHHVTAGGPEREHFDSADPCCLLRNAYLFPIIEQMSKRSHLGNFELMVLLAVIRLGDDAYGVPISHAIEDTTGREVALGSVYASLDRLEDKGLVSSTLGDPTPERGGRAKRYFRVTAKGAREARDTKQALVTLWRGLPELKGGPA